MLEILIPRKVEVRLLGEPCEMRRLSFADVRDLVLEAGEAWRGGDGTEDLVPSLLSGDLPGVLRMAADLGSVGESALRRSFPGFSRWDELPASAVLKLLALVWEENDGAGILADFTRLMGGRGIGESTTES